MKFFRARAEANIQKIERLKNIPIFHTLTRKELFEVDELLHDRLYEKGEIIFEKGEMGHGIFIILSGMVRVNPSPELPANAITEMGPGELLGLLSLFDEAPRLATIVAVEQTAMAALFQAEFSALLKKNKNIGVKVLVEISRILGQRATQLLLKEIHLPTL